MFGYHFSERLLGKSKVKKLLFGQEWGCWGLVWTHKKTIGSNITNIDHVYTNYWSIGMNGLCGKPRKLNAPGWQETVAGGPTWCYRYNRGSGALSWVQVHSLFSFVPFSIPWTVIRNCPTHLAFSLVQEEDKVKDASLYSEVSMLDLTDDWLLIELTVSPRCLTSLLYPLILFSKFLIIQTILLFCWYQGQ